MNSVKSGADWDLITECYNMKVIRELDNSNFDRVGWSAKADESGFKREHKENLYFQIMASRISTKGEQSISRKYIINNRIFKAKVHKS